MNRATLIMIIVLIGATISYGHHLTTRLGEKHKRDFFNFFKLQPIHGKQRTSPKAAQVPIGVPNESHEPIQQDYKVCSLQGNWTNELGSDMIVNVTKEGYMTGKYRTEVDLQNGTVVDKWTELIGYASPSYDAPWRQHRTFGFTVDWDNGTSTTSWTGQCVFCEGQEMLKTFWILSTEIVKCIDYWESNRIGQDTFTRSVQQNAINDHT